MRRHLLTLFLHLVSVVLGVSILSFVFMHLSGDPVMLMLPPVIIPATLRVAGVIVWESGLSFLGLSVPPPTPTWGRMLSDGRAYLANAWWTATFPGLAIMVTVLGVNMLGDGLRDALDPRLELSGK
jgi:peptide/nickel transport system permease protein